MSFRLIAVALLATAGVARFAVAPSGVAGGHPVELKLATSKAGHLFSTEESVKLSVAGMADGQKLQIKRSDPSGDDAGSQDVTVNGGVADLGTLPAGWYHVEARGGGADGAIDIAVARPRPVQKFRDDSPFGVVAPPHEANEWPLLGGMGAAWLQWSMAWAYTEVQPGVYWYMPNAPKSYGDPEGYVKDANKLGIRTIIQIRTVPRWANKGKIGSYIDAGEPRTDTYPPDDDHWDDYSKFVGQVVDRFKPLGVNHYEIWSEAEGSMFKRWETAPFPKLEAYQKLVTRAKKVIQTKDPSAQILAPGDIPVKFLEDAEDGYTAKPTYNNKPDPYSGKSLPAMGKSVDIVSGHLYWTDYVSRPRSHHGPEERNPGRRPDTLKDMIADVQRVAGNRPVWITEVGYGSAQSNETIENVASNEDGQANLLVRYFLLARGWGAKKVFWYVWKDRPAGTTLATSYGLLRPDGTVKPAYLAYRTLAERMEGLNWVIKESGPNRWIVHGLGPRTVVVLWRLKADGRPETVSLPWAKVRITRRDGQVTTESAVDGKVKVQLNSGEPVYLDQAP